ncbi:MAG: hypothetical protein CTY16_12015 [Methylobacter sp.]|nr:MAG: hypothetical protein CTY16_12015 [Methylobacter sp.]
MAAGDPDNEAWLKDVALQQTQNGYWLAWHKGDHVHVNRIAFLTPDHPIDEGCRWLDSFDKHDTIDAAIDYIESGKFEADEEEYPDGFVFNLFIQNPEAGEWE